MFMKLPEHATSFGFDGINYEPNDEGVVELPDEAGPEALRHGLTEVGKALTKKEIKANVKAEEAEAHAEQTAEVKADPEVKEFLEGVKADAKKDKK